MHAILHAGAVFFSDNLKKNVAQKFMRIYNMQFANDFLLKFCCGNLLRTLCGRLSLVHTSDIKPGAH